MSFFCQFYKGINSSPILDLWDSKDISPSQSSREEANFIKKMSSCLRFNRQSRGQISRIRTSVFLLICETNARCNYSTDFVSPRRMDHDDTKSVAEMQSTVSNDRRTRN